MSTINDLVLTPSISIRSCIFQFGPVLNLRTEIRTSLEQFLNISPISFFFGRLKKKKDWSDFNVYLIISFGLYFIPLVWSSVWNNGSCTALDYVGVPTLCDFDTSSGLGFPLNTRPRKVNVSYSFSTIHRVQRLYAISVLSW